MNKASFYRAARSECEGLLRLGVIDRATFDRLSELYPVTKWDWRSLGRWFLIFGAISALCGASILFQTYWGFTLQNLAILLGFALPALFGAGLRLKSRGLRMTGEIFELLGSFALIGFTFTIGAIYSTGSGNWPALLLIDLLILLPVAYASHNALVLTLCSVTFFTWFGGVTGYISGWGAWFFGMNYPLRFFVASILMVSAAFAHLNAEKTILAPWRGFFKVWLSSGLYFGEMALWLMSLFGNYGMIDGGWHRPAPGELLLFNLLWAGTNVALIYVGSKTLMRMMVGYGATFLTIQGYTLFFDHVAYHLGPIFSMLLAGSSAMYLVSFLEKKRRELYSRPGSPEDAR